MLAEVELRITDAAVISDLSSNRVESKATRLGLTVSAGVPCP